jgi:hypothetical protein
MSDPADPSKDGQGADTRKVAAKLADELMPMVQVSRSRQLDFLAYLLGMALKEARRIAAGKDAE